MIELPDNVREHDKGEKTGIMGNCGRRQSANLVERICTAWLFVIICCLRAQTTCSSSKSLPKRFRISHDYGEARRKFLEILIWLSNS